MQKRYNLKQALRVIHENYDNIILYNQFLSSLSLIKV